MELMEGLTLLATDTVGNDSVFLLVVLIGLCAMLFGLGIVSIILMVNAFKEDEFGAGILMFMLAVFAIVVASIGIYAAAKPQETVYKVTIDESVSFVEFNERYEVIEQDGVIYTIIPKGE